MPGVLQIEAMAQTGGILVLNTVDDPENYETYFLKIDKAKFKKKVVPGDTLVFKLELLSPIREGQKRIFTARDRARLKLILRGKRFGFSLESIRQWLELYDLGDSQVTQLTTWVEHANMQMNTLREQRDELEDAMNELQDLINYVERDLEHRGAAEAAE